MYHSNVNVEEEERPHKANRFGVETCVLIEWMSVKGRPTMAAETLLRRGRAGLWLVATLAVVSVSAQNLYVGPGTVVIRQYRPGVGIYRPNSYNYFAPGPFIYGPLLDTQVQIYRAPRIQPYAVPRPQLTPTPASPYDPASSSPYGGYYTPHIPRYYRQQELSEASETPATPAPQGAKSASPTEQQAMPEPPVPIPVPGQAGDAGPEETIEAPAVAGEQVSPPVADQTPPPEAPNRERPRKSARRKPIRYR